MAELALVGGAANQASQSWSGGSTPGGSANSTPAKRELSLHAVQQQRVPRRQLKSHGWSHRFGPGRYRRFDRSRNYRGDSSRRRWPLRERCTNCNSTSAACREWMNMRGSPASMVQIPSDIKTLTYYVRSESRRQYHHFQLWLFFVQQCRDLGSSEPSPTRQGRGLMRLEMDRAVSAYSENNGSRPPATTAPSCWRTK